MNKILSIAAIVILVSIFGFQPTPKAEDPKVLIDLGKKGAEVPASLYGVFFEEINHAGEGGLYAEMIRNRAFEDKEVPAGYSVVNGELVPPAVKNHLSGRIEKNTFKWEKETIPAWTVSSKGDGASIQTTKTLPLDPSTPNNLLVKISSQSTPAIVTNTGFWGIATQKGAEYLLRFYTRSDNYTGAITARLVGTDNAIIANQQVTTSANGKWKEHRLIFIANATQSKAHFELVFEKSGNVFIDYVSLFPKNTYKGRENGLRNDVATFLSDLKPAFIRWPGGCIVEGITVSNRVEWKKTLGDPMKRSGVYDTWGYRNSYGFGYNEFLQYCEDIGAKGMFVCNVGLGCQYRMGDACSDQDVDFYVKDVLDALEYAIGRTNTVWGAKRAKAGHPAPYPLQYVEIGNEQWGALYNKRFDIFYKAIKSKYPQLTLISNHGLGKGVKSVTKTDMIDPHWYVGPDFFFKNHNLFDNIPREDYKVYVGEYACNQRVGGGNMLAALSEAAFISGMERNSDLVKMASYAPLFENKNNREWPVNLIWIDNDKVVGRSSYYVQQLFASNRPSYNVSTQLQQPKSDKPIPLKGEGGIGLGSWITQNEYKDLKITTADGNVISPDMSVGNGWIIPKGDWKNASSGILSQSSLESMAAAYLKGKSFNNFELEVKARKTGGDEGFFVMFGMNETQQTGYAFNIGGWGNTQTTLQIIEDGVTSEAVAPFVKQEIKNNQWYTIKVIVKESVAQLYVDGQLIINYLPTPAPRQFVISGYDEKTNELIIKFTNASNEPYRAQLKIDNATQIENKGTAITLAAKSLKDENSFEEPLKIAPKQSSFDGFSNDFSYTFAANSLTVLRVKVRM